MFSKLMHILRDETTEEGDLGGGGGKDLESQLAAANEKLQKEAEARARAEGEAAALRQTVTNVRESKDDRKEEPQKFTRAQLDQMVEKGTLDKVTADGYWEMQLRNEVTQQVSDRIFNRLEAKERSGKLTAEIRSYQEAFPDTVKVGSETHTKMTSEYTRLVDLGYPRDVSTELLAAKTVCGALPKKGAPKDVTRESRETHTETGGSGAGPTKDPQSKDPVVRMGLTTREKNYYQSAIDKGVYKDWSDVEETMKHSNPNTRKKYNAA